MLTTIQGICMRTVPYSDSRAVLELLTRQYGRLSVSLPQGPGRGTRRRRALTQPMSPVEMVIDYLPARRIMSLRDVTPLAGHATLAGIGLDPAKAPLTVFLADVTARVARDNGPDEALYQYVVGCVDALAAQRRGLELFPLRYLIGLAHVLGVAPDTTGGADSRWLDMASGRLSVTPPLRPPMLEPEQTRLLHTLSIMPFRLLGLIHLDREQRDRALQYILQYYALHLKAIDRLPSLFLIGGSLLPDNY